MDSRNTGFVTKHQVFLTGKIKDYEDIIYCEPDPNSVAKAIAVIMTNESRRRKIQANGLKLAKQFDCDKVAERLLKTFKC